MGMQPEFTYISEDGIILRFQEELYKLEAIQSATHKFTDRCYIHLEQLDGHVIVRLKPRKKLENAEHLAGMIANEVLDQSLRLSLRAQTEPVRNLILAQAFSRTGLVEPDYDSAPPMTDTKRIGYPDPETGRIHED